MGKYEGLTERARRVIPGGINTCIRNYPSDFVTTKVDGAYFWDQHGNRYVDYLGAWGPIVIGYQNKEITKKIIDAVKKYDLYGVGVTESEVILAEKICAYVKGVERVLMCNGGSEATYHAIRVARAYTGREKIIKMQGAFHGWHDYVLMNVASTPENINKIDPFSAGMLKDAVERTLICRINDIDNIRKTCENNKEQIAAVIIDPYCTTFGCMKMHDEYMRGLRALCDEHHIVLIFDEVVTGFRIGLGGAAEKYDITPDLVCMGKAIANGYPVAAIGGKKAIMDRFNTHENGNVSYQATYYGNPVMAATAVAVIEFMEKPGFYEKLEKTGDMLCTGLEEITKRLGIPFYTEHSGSLIGLYFGEGPFSNYDELVKKVDGRMSNAFRKRMIENGHYFAMGDYKRVVVSYAHTNKDIDETLVVAESVLKKIKDNY